MPNYRPEILKKPHKKKLLRSIKIKLDYAADSVIPLYASPSRNEKGMVYVWLNNGTLEIADSLFGKPGIDYRFSAVALVPEN